MNHYLKYLKYKNKYLLLKNKLYSQVGGNQYFIVDSKDETLTEQKTFPYNEINFGEQYSDTFPEREMLLWLKEKTEDLLINPVAPLDNAHWDARIPNGLAYWMRLYPWGNKFTEGRNVLLDSSNCHSLFPPNCSFLESFESKIKSKEIADTLQIKVAKQVSFINNDSEKDSFNSIIKDWCKEAGNKLFFVLKPTSPALSEGVLIAIKNHEKWSFSVPPLALTPLWNKNFKTTDKLIEMDSVSNISNSAYDVAKKWCSLHGHVKDTEWIVQELLPRVREFQNQPMEIKAYLLGGYVWYAIHYVQPTTGPYIKHPFFYRKEDKNWNCIIPPKETKIKVETIEREFTPEEANKLTEKLAKVVSEKIAPTAERIAKTLNVKFMMRADFFIVPDKKHIIYTDDGPTWSLFNLDEIDIYFNEMQHWYGKAVFLEEYGNMFLYPIFQRTVNRLLKIGC